MNKNDDDLLQLFLIVFALFALVALAAAVLILDLLRQLVWGKAPTEEADKPAVSLFGAPKSGWWVENYERWLWRLEDVTGVNFTSSPERLFAGSMLLAGVVGGAGGLISTVFVAVTDIRLSLPVFWVVFLPVLLVCGLSAWILSKPAPRWWQIVQEAHDDVGDDQPGVIFLGELREE